MFHKKTEAVEKIKTYTACLITFLKKSAVCEIMWKNIQLDRPQMTIWRMRISYWIPNATTHTHNIQYLLLFYINIGCTNAPRCYVYTYTACFIHVKVCDTVNRNHDRMRRHVPSKIKKKYSFIPCIETVAQNEVVALFLRPF